MYEAEKDLIYKTLTESDVLCGIAEEASELAQAALKMRRTLDESNNPTPVTFNKAKANLEEEIADVLMYFIVMGCPLDTIIARVQNNPKWKRWSDRVGEGRYDLR